MSPSRASSQRDSASGTESVLLSVPLGIERLGEAAGEEALHVLLGVELRAFAPGSQQGLDATPAREVGRDDDADEERCSHGPARPLTTGFRLHQRQNRSAWPTGRARIGSPRSQRSRSSARASADG